MHKKGIKFIFLGIFILCTSCFEIIEEVSFNKDGSGHVLIQQSIEAIKTNYKTSKITISAQVYLKQFYEWHQFVKEGDEYLEDGIPHIKMIYNS